MKIFFLFYLFSIWTLVGQSANFDTSIKINTIVDTTQVKIGEEILYTIEIKSENNYNIRFDEKPNFIPFEILKTYQTDTLNNSSSFKKEYSLINFEPGEYWIPRQKIYFNQTVKFSDSLLIIVNDVEVDTLKQNLYDIKPIIPVKRNYQKLFYRIIFITVLLALIYLFYKRNPLKSSKEKEELKSLYEIANEKLRDLNNLHPNSQIEFKEYYTILIDIFREYLEYQVNIPAMESTSNELISRINLLKDSGNYNFEKSDINKLENLFTKSDLIKFAKSLPSKKDIYNDVDTISKFIENIEKIYNDKFDVDEDQAEEIGNKPIWTVVSLYLKYSLLVFSSALIISVLIFGYYPVRDTILMNPTKRMLSKEWFISQYGSPPVELNSPNILLRTIDSSDINMFEMGSFKDPFYISLKFKDVLDAQSNSNLEFIKSELINSFQILGSKNILVKEDQFTIKSGDTGLRLFGSLDIESNNKLLRSNFTSVIFPYDQKTINLVIVYRSDDRYANEIETKILESFNIIKEL
jgi:hypothetical protein